VLCGYCNAATNLVNPVHLKQQSWYVGFFFVHFNFPSPFSSTECSIGPWSNNTITIKLTLGAQNFLLAWKPVANMISFGVEFNVLRVRGSDFIRDEK
jgi:hypothetical protein